MATEKKWPPGIGRHSEGGQHSNHAKTKLTLQAEKNKSHPSKYMTLDQWEWFIERVAIRHIDGKQPLPEAELSALQDILPDEYRKCYEIVIKDAHKKVVTAKTADEYAKTEIAAFLAWLQGKQPEPLPPSKPVKYEGAAALAEYTRRGIRLMPCVPVEDDPKRYRPIIGKEKWESTATANSERIMQYMSGALWPNEPIHLFRFIPAEAGFMCFDIDKGHSDGADGEANFYRLMRARGYDPLPLLLRDLQAFTVRVETPNGGIHLYFRYKGPPVKKAKLAEGVEVFHTDPLTAGGSHKENKAYILYGCLNDAPPLPPELLAIITDAGQSYTAPDKSMRRTENNVRGNNDKAELRGRLREYIMARGITITKKGSIEWIRCPLHDDDSPSMQINTTGKYAGLLKCHACGANADIFEFARITAGLPQGNKYFPQVVQEVKAALGIGQ